MQTFSFFPEWGKQGSGNDDSLPAALLSRGWKQRKTQFDVSRSVVLSPAAVESKNRKAALVD